MIKKILPLTKIQKSISYKFTNTKLLEQALIHRSFGNENRSHLSLSNRDNERFEFLGDSIIDFLVSELIMEVYPDASEGELSKIRATIVNDRHLAQIARTLDIGSVLLLGKGEEGTGGRDKESILANTLEAVVAAIYFDGGFEKSKKFVNKYFKNTIKKQEKSEGYTDFKTKLQELVQAKSHIAPVYDVIKMTGPDHDKTFEVQVRIVEKPISKGTGKSKKEAEQIAAKKAIEIMSKKK